MELPEPDLPSQTQWLRHGITGPRELHGGKQSRVFAAKCAGQGVAVKLTNRRFVDAAVLAARMEAVETLACDFDLVVPPIRLDGQLVQEVGGWLMTATAFVHGERLDITDRSDGRLMGVTLAQLHRSLALLSPQDLPPVAALRSDELVASGLEWQLLHGDFSNQNLLRSASGLRLFDFDECGYGPIEYDVGNSLYIVFFDAEVTKRPAEYQLFREAFLHGYSAGAECSVATELVDEMIAVRIRALARWLDDPGHAPIGIRTASADWHDTLRQFVSANWDLAEPT